MSITISSDFVYWLAMVCFLVSMFWESIIIANQIFTRDGDMTLNIIGTIFRYGSVALLTYTLTVPPTIT